MLGPNVFCSFLATLLYHPSQPLSFYCSFFLATQYFKKHLYKVLPSGILSHKQDAAKPLSPPHKPCLNVQEGVRVLFMGFDVRG